MRTILNPNLPTHLRVRMERPEIQRLNRQVRHKVNPHIRLIRVSRRVRLLEPPLIANRHKMVRIDRLDIRTDLPSPRRNRTPRNIARRTRTTRTPRAPRLIRQLPRHNRRIPLIPPHEFGYVFLVGGDDGGIGVERVVRAAGVELRDVDVHAAVVGPVVGESDDEVEAAFAGLSDDGVEAGDAVGAGVECRDAVRPELVIRAVLLRCRHVVEAPTTIRSISTVNR